MVQYYMLQLSSHFTTCTQNTWPDYSSVIFWVRLSILDLTQNLDLTREGSMEEGRVGAVEEEHGVGHGVGQGGSRAQGKGLRWKGRAGAGPRGRGSGGREGQEQGPGEKGHSIWGNNWDINKNIWRWARKTIIFEMDIKESLCIFQVILHIQGHFFQIREKSCYREHLNTGIISHQFIQN